MFWIWLGFILFVLLMLALDLGVFHRHAHVVTVKEALVGPLFGCRWALLLAASCILDTRTSGRGSG